MPRITTDSMLDLLRASGEETRLRILALLLEGERSVKDLTEILGQSQPRISRHLKLLADAGLVARHREGGWAFFRLAESGPQAGLLGRLLSALDPGDPVLTRDRLRLARLRDTHAQAAADYFRRHAARWDRIRSLHVKDARIEATILRLLGDERLGTVIDLGTGTGRMLELLADRFDHGIGIDSSQDMLSYARSRLERAGLSNCRLRRGDIHHLALADGTADAILFHQVLHYLDDPQKAIAEAVRLLKAGGQLLVVDFAPHGLEYLREEHSHRRLGFSHGQMAQWLKDAGIDLVDQVDLPPGDAEGDETKLLTVSVWLGRRRAGAVPSSARAEEAA